jgi:hypothetical protein
VVVSDVGLGIISARPPAPLVLAETKRLASHRLVNYGKVGVSGGGGDASIYSSKNSQNTQRSQSIDRV